MHRVHAAIQIHALPTCMQARLSAPTAEGRRLRRRLLRGTVAVLIVAGYQGKRFIYERAKELGIRSVMTNATCYGSMLDHDAFYTMCHVMQKCTYSH